MLNQELVLSFQRALMIKMELDRVVALSMSKQTARRVDQESQGMTLESEACTSNFTDVTNNTFSIENYRAIASPQPNDDL